MSQIPQTEEFEPDYLQTLPLSVTVVRWLLTCWPVLLLSLPCVLVGLAVWVLVYSGYENQLTQVSQYLADAQKRVDAKDYDEASLCYQRAIQMGAGTDEVVYKLAKVYQQQDENDLALGIISSLAPLNQTGYAPAPLDLATSLLSQPNLQSAGVGLAESHLRRILDQDPNSLDANSLLGQIYARTGRLAEARNHLFMVMKDRPGFMLQVAALERALCKDKDADTTARQAVNAFSKLSRDDPTNPGARLSLAAATAFLKDFTGAESILNTGLEKADRQEYHAALSNLYLAWADDSMKNRKKGPDDWMPLLEKAMQQAPESPVIDQFRLLMVRNQRNDAETNQALRDLLARSEEKSTGVLFLLGLDAWEQKRAEEARQYLDEAYKADPSQVGVANNLAWMLATGDKPDLPRALEVINHALEAAPGTFEMYGTRGRVLVRMQRYREALVDLEKSLRAKSGPNLHGDLADAYEALGMAELATIHRRKSAEARTALEAAKPSGS